MSTLLRLNRWPASPFCGPSIRNAYGVPDGQFLDEHMPEVEGLVDVWIQFDDLRWRCVVVFLKQQQLHGCRIAGKDGKVNSRFVRSGSQWMRRSLRSGEIHDINLHPL